MSQFVKYRADIDGLRAVAILPVLLFHAGIAGFSGGFVGVDIFFVISGYLITSIIVREVSAGQFTYREFWARRARRILPASVVMMVACLVAGWFLMAPDDYFELGRSAREQAYFAANFFFWKESGYFDGPSELKPLLHTWSLAVEEQFYVVFPLLFIVCHKFFDRFKVAFLLLLLVASLVASVVLIKDHPSATFYLLHTRAWELLMGSLLAVIPPFLVQQRALREGVSLVALVVIAFCVATYDASTVFPGLAALPPVLATAAIIWANSYHNTIAKRLLSLPPMVWVGLISYSLYLWHWPLMAFTRYSSVEELVLLDKLLLVLGSFVLGYLSWRFIETPFRVRKFLPTNKRILWGAFASLLIIAIAGQQIRRTEGYPPRLPEQARNYAIAADWSKYQKRCYKLDEEEIAAGAICRFGAENNPQAELFFWGDSHAAAFLPAVKAQSEQHGVLTLHASRSGCPPLLGGERVDDPACATFNKNMYQLIAQYDVKTVLLAGRWSAYIYGESKGSDVAVLFKDPSVPKSEAVAKQLFTDAITTLVADLRSRGITVWIAKQVPFHHYASAGMSHELTLRSMKGMDVASIGLDKTVHTKRHAFVNGVLDSLQGDGVHLLDPTPLLCTEGFCPGAQQGFSMYKDRDHLSVQGAEMIQGLFQPLFLSLKATKASALE